MLLPPDGAGWRTALVAGLLLAALLQPGPLRGMLGAVRLWLRRSLVRRAWIRVRHARWPLEPARPARVPGFYADAALAGLLLLGVTALQAAPDRALAISLPLGMILLLAGLIDLRWYCLPDRLTLPLGGIGLLARCLDGDGASAVLGIVLGGSVLLSIRLGYRILRGAEGLGLGDVKLVAAMGAWLAPEPLLQAVVAAALAGCAAGAGLVLARKRDRSAPLRLPFGPFLVCAFWGAWLLGPPA